MTQPEHQTAAAPEAPADTDAAQPQHVEMDQGCFKCGYNLRGLPLAGRCPECGSTVADSLRGFLLQFAGPEYQATLRSGLSYILNGILLMIVFAILTAAVTIGAGFLAGRGGVGATGLTLIVQGLSLIPAAMMIWGYWRFSEPDPQFEATEQPRAARRVMRISVALSAALALAGFVLQVLVGSGMVAPPPGAAGGPTATTFSLALIIVPLLLGLCGLVVWAVQFFSTLLYTRWLAQRVPDAFIQRRAKRYMWLLPVVYVFGSILIVGPLIALILYWNLLDRLRKHIKAILATGAPAKLKGALG
ncbi:MAG: hypothetical protein ACKVS8_02785 [Phycisphaerales bacterium]